MDVFLEVVQSIQVIHTKYYLNGGYDTHIGEDFNDSALNLKEVINAEAIFDEGPIFLLLNIYWCVLTTCTINIRFTLNYALHCLYKLTGALKFNTFLTSKRMDGLIEIKLVLSLPWVVAAPKQWPC